MTSQTLPEKTAPVCLPRIAFLGMGWIGRRRLESLVNAKAAEVVAIIDPIPEQLEKTRLLAPDAAYVESLEEFALNDLDGVVISTPSALHATQTISALGRGCAVFCQKPLGRNAQEVSTMIEAARSVDRLLGVDLSYRHLRGSQAIRELIRAGALGDVFAADLVFHNAYGPDKPWFYDPALSGGGCVIDLGIHLVDLALWMLDTEVLKVAGRVLAAGKPLQGPPTSQVEDYASAVLSCASGAQLQLACSWRLHAGRDAIIEARFYGTRGGAALLNVNGSFTEFRAEHFTGTRSEVLIEPPDEWGGRALLAWVQELAKSPHYNPEIERQINVAEVLDAIYGRPSAAPLLSSDRP